MTTKAEWIALAERCEKATGPDREIDATMEAYAGKWSADDLEYVLADIETNARIDVYTRSLDAITALIERELPEMRWLCRPDKEGGFGTLYAAPEAIEQGSLKTWETIKQESLKEWPCWAYADTPALALCAAFCRAMAEKVTA
jgi:hypothetical protein